MYVLYIFCINLFWIYYPDTPIYSRLDISVSVPGVDSILLETPQIEILGTPLKCKWQGRRPSAIMKMCACRGGWVENFTINAKTERKIPKVRSQFTLMGNIYMIQPR